MRATVPHPSRQDPSSANADVSPTWQRYAPLILALVTFAIFARAIAGEFVWDDWLMLVRNPHFNPPTLESLRHYWAHPTFNVYQPLTVTLWMAMAKLGYTATPDAAGSHLNPWVFHGAGVLLHVVASVTVYRILRLLRLPLAPAIVGAAAFALHPIQVEATTFVGALNNPLFAALALLAIGDYLRWTDPANAGEAKGLWWLRGSALLVLAMLAKPTAVVVPVVAAALDLAAHRRSLRATIVSALPWCAIALPCVVATTMNQHGVVAAGQGPAIARPLIALDSIAVQLLHVLWPSGITIDYGRNPAYVLAHPAQWPFTAALTIAMLVAAVSLRRRAPLLAASMLVFVLGLLPNSGLVPFDYQANSTVADRYAYLPMLGIAIAIAWALTQAIVARATVAPIAYGIAGLMLTILASLAVRQVGYWHDDLTLFTRAASANPRSELALENLSFAYEQHGDAAAAFAAVGEAVRVAPQSADAYARLGAALMAWGDRATAIGAFRHAIELRPDDLVTRHKLARALDAIGDRAAAIAEYRNVLFAQPADAGVMLDLAAALAESGDLDAAIALYHQALQRNPQLDIARRGLAQAEAARAATKPTTARWILPTR